MFNSKTSSPPDSACSNVGISRPISWPSELAIGSEEAWSSFAKLRGYSYPAVWLMAQAGILRFCVVNGHKCIAITDSERRAAEIRRVDGGLFGSGSKAFPLKGVDKRWLVGAALLSDTADATSAQTTYRQALRDITKSATSLDDVTWPTKP